MAYGKIAKQGALNLVSERFRMPLYIRIGENCAMAHINTEEEYYAGDPGLDALPEPLHGSPTRKSLMLCLPMKTQMRRENR